MLMGKGVQRTGLQEDIKRGDPFSLHGICFHSFRFFLFASFPSQIKVLKTENGITSKKKEGVNKQKQQQRTIYICMDDRYAECEYWGGRHNYKVTECVVPKLIFVITVIRDLCFPCDFVYFSACACAYTNAGV